MSSSSKMTLPSDFLTSFLPVMLWYLWFPCNQFAQISIQCLSKHVFAILPYVIMSLFNAVTFISDDDQFVVSFWRILGPILFSWLVITASCSALSRIWTHLHLNCLIVLLWLMGVNVLLLTDLCGSVILLIAIWPLCCKFLHFQKFRRTVLSCRRVGRKRVKQARRPHAKHFFRIRGLKLHRASLLHSVSLYLSSYLWSLSSKARNLLVHILNGNISSKELTTIVHEKLGMKQPWIKDSIKRVLQDTARKQKAHDFAQQHLYYEIGKLISELPPVQSHARPLGKGAGKGSSSRTPWSALAVRPKNLFVDQNGAQLEIISQNQALNAAKGVFLCAGRDIDSFLGITSNQPLAMLVPGSDFLRNKFADLSISFRERQLALFDELTGITSPRHIFLVQLGTTVNFQVTTPDVDLQAPPELVELSVDLELDQVDTAVQHQLSTNVKSAFRSIVCAALGEKCVQLMYSISQRNNVISALIKAPRCHLEQLLLRSGPNGLYVKEKVRPQRTTVCPTALIHETHLREPNLGKFLDVAAKLPSFAGVHRSSTGSKSFRFYPAGIKRARLDLCKSDLFSDINCELVPSKFYQVQGIPIGVPPAAIVEALSNWGWTIVCIKSWSLSPLMVSWLVGCDSEPPGEFIAIKDYIVTVVPDGVSKPISKTRPSLSDPLSSNDPWARYFEKAKIDEQSAAASVIPRPPCPAPKVQQVVENRIEASEAKVMAEVARITSEMQKEFKEQICALEAKHAATADLVRSLDTSVGTRFEELKNQSEQMEARLIAAISGAQPVPSPDRKKAR